VGEEPIKEDKERGGKMFDRSFRTRKPGAYNGGLVPRILRVLAKLKENTLQRKESFNERDDWGE